MPVECRSASLMSRHLKGGGWQLGCGFVKKSVITARFKKKVYIKKWERER